MNPKISDCSVSDRAAQTEVRAAGQTGGTVVLVLWVWSMWHDGTQSTNGSCTPCTNVDVLMSGGALCGASRNVAKLSHEQFVDTGSTLTAETWPIVDASSTATATRSGEKHDGFTFCSGSGGGRTRICLDVSVAQQIERGAEWVVPRILPESWWREPVEILINGPVVQQGALPSAAKCAEVGRIVGDFRLPSEAGNSFV